MIASSAIMHLARNGDISLTASGVAMFICIIVLLLLNLLNLWR